MSATLYSLNRHHDISGVSGTGDDKATICEFESGLIAMHWNSPTPSVTVFTDMRDVENLHGHQGASTVEILDKDRLLRAYARVMPYALNAVVHKPHTIGPHPEHPDRLRLVFGSYAQEEWAFWIALFDGSTDAATQDEVNGEIEHRWISPDGDLWLIYHTRTETPGTAWESHDDPEVER